MTSQRSDRVPKYAVTKTQTPVGRRTRNRPPAPSPADIAELNNSVEGISDSAGTEPAAGLSAADTVELNNSVEGVYDSAGTEPAAGLSAADTVELNNSVEGVYDSAGTEPAAGLSAADTVELNNSVETGRSGDLRLGV